MAIHGIAAGALTSAAEVGAYGQDLLREILAGLARPQKELPSKLFYDERGSELFEEITRLPEYYLTRAETALLRDRAPGWISELRPRALVELGAGSAAKTRSILDAMSAQCAAVTYVPIDISADFLTRTATMLRSEYATVHVMPVVADFMERLALPPATPSPALIAFLGSTIGNFPHLSASQLLRRIRCSMRSGDRFLLGVDLRKDVSVLEGAYNDARGVTAAFNRNLLQVVNRRVGADFDADAFEHRAFYNSAEHRIEMHLVSARPQVIHFARGQQIALAAGESIRTEISCKYDQPAVAALFCHAGLELIEWAEHADGLFALALAAPIDDRPTRTSTRELTMSKQCKHVTEVRDVQPGTPEGCEECLATGSEWVHLRLCLSCGHVGCCDNSPNRHATKHFHQTKHPIIKSFEPGENWGWCYVDELFMEPAPEARP